MAITYIKTNKEPIKPGDMAPPFMGFDQTDTHSTLWGLAGDSVVVFFYSTSSMPECDQLLKSFSFLHKAYLEAGSKIIAIGMDSRETIKKMAMGDAIPYPVLSAFDLKGLSMEGLTILKHYAVMRELIPQNTVEFSPTSFIIDENSRIRKIIPIIDATHHAEEVLRDVQALLPVRESRVIAEQAPVLFVDNVLSKEECDYLISVWETQGNRDSGSMITTNDGRTEGVLNYNQKIRRDHFITDVDLLTHLDISLRRRVFPQIKKAFHFECTRREDYKIACYDSDRGGYFRRHRDNTTEGTAHRVFAMSLNLNSEDYDGGYLRFPEFSNNLYKPKTGSALIFSGSMVHEATDVSNGKRFVLLQFLYGEREAKIREANQHKIVENEVTTGNKI